jgi:Domain of unknown function (DUF4390)
MTRMEMQPRSHESTKKTDRFFSSCLRVFVVAFVSGAGVLAAVAEAPDLTVTPITRDNQAMVSFELTDGFTADVRDAIQSGLPTTFSYEIDLRRWAATWFDRTLASVTLAATGHFDNLTGRYQMSRSVDGRIEDAWFLWPWDRAAVLGHATFTFIP